MTSIPAPKSGKGPMMKTGGKMPVKPAAKLGKVAAGAPTKGTGSDTSPYSSAKRGKK